MTRSVPIPMDHFSAAAIMALHFLAMEGLVWISMSVQQAHTTASKTVVTHWDHLSVDVLLGTD